MMLRRLLSLSCVALFGAAGAHAQAQSPHDAPPPLERPSQRGSRLEPLARGEMNAPLPTERREYDRYSPRRDSRYERPLQADPMEQRYQTLRNRYEVPQNNGRDLNLAVESARRRHGGKVLSAERMQMDGREVYRVKLLTPSGRVRIVQMPNTEIAPTSNEQQGEH